MFDKSHNFVALLRKECSRNSLANYIAVQRNSKVCLPWGEIFPYVKVVFNGTRWEFEIQSIEIEDISPRRWGMSWYFLHPNNVTRLQNAQ